MTNPGSPNRQYEFGVFTVDTRGGELRKYGTRIKLQERPFQLLVALVEKPGEVVTREDLRHRFWPDGTFVDFDHSISTSVNKLRGVLNDSSTHPRYIETVGRRGYRFLADVKCLQAAHSPAAVPSEEAVSLVEEAAPVVEIEDSLVQPPATNRRQLPFSSSRRSLVFLSMSVMALTFLAGYFLWPRSHNRRMAPGGRVTLAVLPFDNLTGDAGQDYFSDGMTEEMIAQLGRLDPQHMAVISRTSVMHYKHSQERLDQIGHELGVEYVLEGSVRRDSRKVRITAQLIQVNDQTHLWSRQYDRELKDLLSLQGEIAREISDEIPVVLGGHKSDNAKAKEALSPHDYEAYNLYLQGLFFWNKRTIEGFQEAINYFQQATAKDPNFARAYAGLADAYALIGDYAGTPRPEYARNARASALRALELDPNLPEAHTAYALVVEGELNWKTAEAEFQRAIELNPNYATAHHWYAEYLTWRGRFDEALRESERARQLDPLSLIIGADKGAILYYSRQYDRAIEQFRYVLDMEPGFPRAGLITDAYVQKGMFAEAQAALEKQPRGNGLWYWAKMAYLHGRAGRQALAERALEKVLLLSQQQQEFDAQALAAAYLGVGDKSKAMDWLEKAYVERPCPLTVLKVDPVFDALRDDLRFKELLKRVELDGEQGSA